MSLLTLLKCWLDKCTLLLGSTYNYLENGVRDINCVLNVAVQQKPEENGTIIDGCDSNASSCEIKVTSSAFGQVNLSDCGLPERILHRFCSADPDVCLFDSLKFCDKVYTWS